MTPNHSECPVALSPDGTRLAYRADADGVVQLHLRAMDSLQARSLPGTQDARAPSFPPDGVRLGFAQGGAIRKVPVAGGEPETVCEECVAVARGLTWGPKDTIVFTPTVDTGGVWAVSADGGAPQPLTQVDPEAGETNHRWAQLLPQPLDVGVHGPNRNVHIGSPRGFEQLLPRVDASRDPSACAATRTPSR